MRRLFKRQLRIFQLLRSTSESLGKRGLVCGARPVGTVSVDLVSASQA